MLQSPPAIFILVLVAGFVLLMLTMSRSGARREGRVCRTPECQFQNPAHARYCARCGRRLDG